MINFQTYLDDNRVDEAIKRKAVIRNKKKVIKFKTTRPGKYRIEIDPVTKKPKEVRITAGERRRRKLGQKRAKLKRKSKQKGISLKRKRSFKMRKSIGLHYNKKNPDINVSREQNPAKKTLATIKKATTLHPANESYLCENPHAFLDDEYELVWDFYAEVEKDWLEQLLTIYRDHYLESEVEDGNISNVITFDENDLNSITDNLINNIEFLMTARTDILDASPELISLLKKYVPLRLLSKIIRI